ncbi:MAG: PASTA domain-containing protein [Candidatus Latescibacteria bacterium]|nr:PASTA domain-containing protein [Candidatus Latescibacterota bacterium]
MKKILLWIVILVCAFGLGFLVFNLLIMPRIAGTGKNVTVPDLVGKPLAEAQKIILGQELEFGSVRAVYDTSYGHGFVVGQKPLAGSVVRSGRSINLIVSKGPQIVKIPFLEQMGLEQGLRVLTSLGINQISIDSLRSATIPSGKILGVEPGPGSEIPVSGPVKIFVSSGGSGIFLMPSLIGLPVDIALDTINYNGLILGSLQTIPSDEWPGLVIIQYPEAGMRVKTSDTVRMIVSRGQE